MTIPDSTVEHPAVDTLMYEKLRSALEGLRETGAAHAPAFLPDPLLRGLIAEAERHDFEDHSGSYLLAEQRVSNLAVEHPYDGFPAIAELATALSAHARELLPDVEGAADYAPTEAKFNLYPPGNTGITAHRDSARDKFMIVSLTLRGEADFVVRELPPEGATREETFAARRQAPVIERWHTYPGDLVLLRAPGFDGIEDGRPLHEVTGGDNGQERLALIYRMIVEEGPSDG